MANALTRDLVDEKQRHEQKRTTPHDHRGGEGGRETSHILAHEYLVLHNAYDGFTESLRFQKVCSCWSRRLANTDSHNRSYLQHNNTAVDRHSRLRAQDALGNVAVGQRAAETILAHVRMTLEEQHLASNEQDATVVAQEYGRQADDGASLRT